MQNPQSDIYVFADESNSQQTVSAEFWKVLIVDDDEDVHRVTKLAFVDLQFEQKKIAFLSAYSIAQAQKIVEENPDIALVLLDVVMEQEDSGLQFVKYLREEAKNQLIRIIIRTGQPGFAPEKKIIIEYDINDYKQKTESTVNYFFTSIIMALRSFHDLQQLAASKCEVETIAHAANRFVPRTFLKLLKKESIADVKLADYVEQEMTVLFLDIRSFTTLSEFLTPLETFQFINDCMSYLEPVIVKHNGFIDKYMGDAIMALFPDSADDAVQAGIEMLQSLESYNYERITRRQMPIKIGIGINTGWVVMGALGFYDRIDCTVISDAVNVAARIEKLNKHFGTSLLISDETFTHLAESERFNYRNLGKIQVPGKKQRLIIYEIFDADVSELVELKQQTKLTFAEAVRFYQLGDNMTAKQYFQKILEKNHHDMAVKYYLEKINGVYSSSI